MHGRQGPAPPGRSRSGAWRGAWVEAAVATIRVVWVVLRSPSERLTLDQLRSDLAHESAAKIARLSGLVQEWRQGRFRPRDPEVLTSILHDLERVYLRHARLAGAHLGSATRIRRLVATSSTLRRLLRSIVGSAASPAELQPHLIDACTDLVARLQAQSHALVEDLSRRLAVRLEDLLRHAAEEVRREAGCNSHLPIAIVGEASSLGASTWLPLADSGPWADLLRNFVRNAVQATKERQIGSATGATVAPAVTVRVKPQSHRPGTTVEILDEGVGMTQEEVAAMWRSGQSSHGHLRGQGLTEGKRAWLAQRAEIEVRSAKNVGTCVRIDIPHCDIPIPPPRLWQLPALGVPVAAAGLAVILGWTFFSQPAIVSVHVESDRIVRAYDRAGAVVWQRDMEETVLPNSRRTSFKSATDPVNTNQLLVVRGRWPWDTGIILATQSLQGPGRVWRLDARGKTRWVRTLDWTPPREAHSGKLSCFFETQTSWNFGGRKAIALNVRDGNHSATELQFITPGNEWLGAYHHPGHLDWGESVDVDGDGRTEVILTGINNEASADRSFLSEDPGVYVDCVVMLEPPEVGGQAYPYRDWESLPPAVEEGYLLVPPLRPGLWARILGLSMCHPAADGEVCIELPLADGRIYKLDRSLRPVACGVADFTEAYTRAPAHPMAPLLYLHDGKLERIDLEIRRGAP